MRLSRPVFVLVAERCLPVQKCHIGTLHARVLSCLSILFTPPLFPLAGHESQRFKLAQRKRRNCKKKRVSLNFIPPTKVSRVPFIDTWQLLHNLFQSHCSEWLWGSWGNARVITNGPVQAKQPEGVAAAWCWDRTLQQFCPLHVGHHVSLKWSKWHKFLLFSARTASRFDSYGGRKKHSWALVQCMSGWGQGLRFWRQHVSNKVNNSLSTREYLSGTSLTLSLYWLCWCFSKAHRCRNCPGV